MRKVLLAIFALIMPLMAFSQDVKIGYIDAEQVMMSMPEIADVEKQMAEYNEKNTKYLEEMEAEIKKEEAKYQEMEATATATMKADQEAKLQTLYQRYQTTMRTIQQDAQQKQVSLLQPIQERLVKAIESVGEKNGFLYITEKNALLYKSSKLVDVTELVKKEVSVKAPATATPAATTTKKK